jgi:hypothetical protein
MSWVITGSQPFPAVIGEPFGGGFFAGYISHTADGNATHALIVAPRATGATGTGYTLTTNLAWAANANAPDGVNYSTTSVGGSFTGSITGTTMSVTAVASGKIRPGHTITGTTVAMGTTVVSQVSGTTNGVGDYTVTISQTVTSRALTAGTSEFDGVANGNLYKDIDPAVGTGSAVTTVFPAANFCESLSIGDYTDWYVPSRYESDIAYFNLKPSTQVNNTGFGLNIYSVPRRDRNNSTNFPIQTNLTAWQATAGSQAFVADFHWSSTEGGPSPGWGFFFSVGSPFNTSIANILPIRAFRRIAL